MVLAVAAGAGGLVGRVPVGRDLACGALGVSFSVFLMGCAITPPVMASLAWAAGLAGLVQPARRAGPLLLAFSGHGGGALEPGLWTGPWPVDVTFYLGLTSLAVLLSNAPWWMRWRSLVTSLDSK